MAILPIKSSKKTTKVNNVNPANSKKPFGIPFSLSKEKIISLSHSLVMVKKNIFARIIKSSFWFIFGACIGLFFFTSFLFVFYQKIHTNLIYDGIVVNGVDFGGKTKEDVISYFSQKNRLLSQTKIIHSTNQSVATISANQLDFGYDENLLAQQAFILGRSDNILSNLSIILQAYANTVRLPAAYHYSDSKIDKLIAPLKQQVEIKPVDALFNFENGKVVAFQLSSDGQTIDISKLKQLIYSQLLSSALADKPQIYTINVPIKVVKPNIGNDKAQSLGIKELIGEGTSLFHHSDDNRSFNINLAAKRLNGSLVPPGQTFSFTKALGDISAFTGYKQAYVIDNGKTVLGDGGGVCQVSTTLFRAILNSGLPVIERHPHAYRVGYYEQDSPPGIDAAVYSPTVDLKFKNDTGNYILIQSLTNLDNQSITFQLYGTKDNREVDLTTPVILSESPAPDPLYQDDPTLPKGTIKQVDFAAGGASVYFTRTVTKNGKVILADKFVSNYKPWQAIYMRGTKE